MYYGDHFLMLIIFYTSQTSCVKILLKYYKNVWLLKLCLQMNTELPFFFWKNNIL